ncbi:MAG: ATP-binding protein [Clostridia bacterium]|nr:ATP-binding protein [Clostridia bacterium]
MINFKVDNLKTMRKQLEKFTDFLTESEVCEDDVFASKLVSCELLTNVIRHGGDEAEFCGQLLDGGIKITVSAESLKGVDINGEPPDVFAESGRGLYIVKVFSTSIERGTAGEISVLIKRR